VALGTVFTVEFTDHKFRVAMMHGRVAVVPLNSGTDTVPVMERPFKDSDSGTNSATVELVAGEELEIGRDGRSTVIADADLEAATAWRKGKVVFRTERLADAVRRMNRYSHVQLEIEDPALADETVSGVFEAGDTQGFIAGVQLALPVVISYRGANTVRLSLSPGQTPHRP
jgi:transmembrane sensor